MSSGQRRCSYDVTYHSCLVNGSGAVRVEGDDHTQIIVDGSPSDLELFVGVLQVFDDLCDQTTSLMK